MWKTLFLCSISALGGELLGIWIGAGVTTNDVAAVVTCVKDPDSCGLDEEDLDPPERLIPAVLKPRPMKI